MRKISKAVVLLSGGMDSATLLHYVKKRLRVPQVFALSILYGQKHSREIEMAKWQARSACVADHVILDISSFGRMVAPGSVLTGSVEVPDLASIPESRRRQPPTYVPNRNMIFLSVAAAYAEAIRCEDVFYGAQAQDEYGYWDCTVDFVRRINDVLRLNRGRPVRVHAPFARKSKSNVLKLGMALGVDYARTWTCYRGGRKPCGACPSCVERDKAFEKACGIGKGRAG